MKRALLVIASCAALALFLWSSRQRRPARDGASPRSEAAAVAGVEPAAPSRGPGPETRVKAPGATSGAAAPRPGTLATAAWGSGPGQLGRSRPDQGNPEGPASFTIDGQGRLLVLDRVNGRIVRYDREGHPLPALLTTQRSPQELLVAPDGALLVMDRLADRSIAILDADGHLKGELPITGKGLEQGGSATGMFADADGVYVENEHSQVVRVGDAAGMADPERPLLDGRPSRDGKSLLSAGVIDPGAGRFWVRVVDRASGALRVQRAVVLPVPFFSLVLLDSDRAGGIYVGAHVGREVEPGQVRDEALQVVCLSPQWQVRGVAVLPASTLPEETFRELAVEDDGTIVHMERSEAGVSVRTYHCS